MSVAELPNELERLGRTAQREHELASAAEASALTHAILAGEALSAAREMLSGGEWGGWVADNTSISRSTATRYIRIAKYKAELPDPESLSIKRAEIHLQGLPATVEKNASRRIDPEAKDEIDRLAKTDRSVREIAETVGVSWVAAKEHLDPEYRKRRNRQRKRDSKRRRAAAAALRKQEEAAAVRRVGGSAADAYGVIREKLCPTLDKAISNSQDAEERNALRAALRAAHRAEEEILKALKIGRTG